MPNASWACGNAMFTMVASRMTINCERAMTASASQRFGSSARSPEFSSDAVTLLTSSGGGVDTVGSWIYCDGHDRNRLEPVEEADADRASNQSVWRRHRRHNQF